jgi:HEAT repeat protein
MKSTPTLTLHDRRIVMNDLMKHKKMDEIVIAICSHTTLKEAATSLSCDVRTLQRYMEMEEFAERFFEFTRLTQRAAAVTLAANHQKAIQVISELLDSPKDSIRLQAANSLLRHYGPMVNEAQVFNQIQMIKSLIQKKEMKEEE